MFETGYTKSHLILSALCTIIAVNKVREHWNGGDAYGICNFGSLHQLRRV